MSTQQPPLRFTSHHCLPHRLVLSTLLGRTVHISQIRPSSPTTPGLSPSDISFLRLLEAVTNGSHIEISYTGTVLLYKPGLITGSAPGSGANAAGVLRHEVPASNTRGLSYFLLPICLLAPFSKSKFNILFSGPGVITSSVDKWGDMSVDSVRTAILPLYEKFGIERDIELRVLQRANTPSSKGTHAGGEVQLIFNHQIRLPKTLHMLSPGRIKKVRGVAYSTGVSGGNNARSIEAARGVLNALCGDVYVFSDVSSAPMATVPNAGASGAGKRKMNLGFGLSLVAESSTRCLFSADMSSPPEGGVPPEDIGQSCAFKLLESVQRGGCVSTEAAPTILTLMAMGSEDVGRVQLGKDVVASENVIQLARDLQAFGGAGWGFREAGEDKADEVVVSVVGNGIGNVGRKVG
ncbi:putative RNA 3'-terminal phosphate cyclase-like protein [Cyphellophora attinorum]|uniref:Putative RNA 3'-terminal phosphate cyclase-like protein n=1 Tax=Cyphellophora attinorum TaxID=1664694 RepID=A0A0N0NP52_9EURO|nr:putative RNA 3'-terminal phosphate cyclase-like protein [Phialophora attinorum]KPI42318.1 putative RNA 3'-terminal phosphate cyclase-like protein [Phialophora attinorum]